MRLGSLFLASTLALGVQGKTIKKKGDPLSLNKFTPVVLTTDTAALSEGDRKALEKIIEASRHLDPLYLRQVWAGNPALAERLSKETKGEGKQLWQAFRQNVGPWLRLEHDRPFIPTVGAKPKGAGFYPEDLTREEFDAWVAKLPESEQKKARGFFWLVSRKADRSLELVPYSTAYAEHLKPAATLLKEAAELTTNASLRKFLKARAEAFGSDDYYASDVAWMDLDAPLEITVGPYETYEDELFGYKAAFESFVAVRHDTETKKLERFSGELQDIENHLPMDAKYKNPKLGAMAPIRVVDLVFSSGEARRGVMTAAFNLPNDEKVVAEKGSKRVMLRNVQRAKFEKILTPISGVAVPKEEAANVQFDPFFTHILMHELAHGIGPHNLKGEGKEGKTVRGELKELYSAIEEAKADIVGLWALQYLIDQGKLDKGMEKTLYTTFLASSFRTVRFGIGEAHGKGMALQFNYLWDEGAFHLRKDGRFEVVAAKVKPAVEKLSREILTLQAEGNYNQAKALLEKYGVMRPAMGALLKKLETVPVDIEPTYPLAGETPGTHS